MNVEYSDYVCTHYFMKEIEPCHQILSTVNMVKTRNGRIICDDCQATLQKASRAKYADR